MRGLAPHQIPGGFWQQGQPAARQAVGPSLRIQPGHTVSTACSMYLVGAEPALPVSCWNCIIKNQNRFHSPGRNRKKSETGMAASILKQDPNP